MPHHLSQIAHLVSAGELSSALTQIRAGWEPGLSSRQRAPLYGLWTRALCEQGQLARAMQVAQRFADEFPQDPDAWTALGIVQESYGNISASIEAFARAVDLAGHSQLAHYNLGTMYERSGQLDKAQLHFERSLQGEEGLARLAEAADALGSLLRRQGQLAHAEQVYEDYLQDDPLDVDLLVEHGVCLAELSRLTEASRRFEEALELSPSHTGASYNLAVVYDRLGRSEDALATMVRAHELDPGDPLTQAVLGAWMLQHEPTHTDWALNLIYRAQDTLLAQFDAGHLMEPHAGMVMEEIFEGLWNSGRLRAAREVARAAGRRDWITPHMLDTLNRHDHGPHAGRQLFRVSARAVLRKDKDRPLIDFPGHIDGYTTDLTVVADDEEEARTFSREYLQELDPPASLEIVVRKQAPPVKVDTQTPARGVAQVTQLNFFSTRAVGRRR